MDDTKVTVDHNTIKAWAKQFGGKPEILDDKEAKGDEVTIRINFPGITDESFIPDNLSEEDISWDEFFQKFDAQDLAFEYTDKKQINDPSAAYHFIKRENAGSA